MSRVVQQSPVPPEIVALSAFESPSYADLFVLALDEPIDATAEQLAHAAVDATRPAGRYMAWRMLCALRLAPPGPDVIGGWRIEERGSTWIRLSTSSPVMSANMVFVLEDSRGCFATFIRYDQPIAALTWGATASRLHRRVAPGFLGVGLSRLRSQQTTTAES